MKSVHQKRSKITKKSSDAQPTSKMGASVMKGKKTDRNVSAKKVIPRKSKTDTVDSHPHQSPKKRTPKKKHDPVEDVIQGPYSPVNFDAHEETKPARKPSRQEEITSHLMNYFLMDQMQDEAHDANRGDDPYGEYSRGHTVYGDPIVELDNRIRNSLSEMVMILLKEKRYDSLYGHLVEYKEFVRDIMNLIEEGE